ncbi:MAG TPA: amidohydrolase family protein [Gemmatimonadales bacterium]|nr:amidohydrolase family protein [Gemmatimonadales bacterium]
MLRPMLALVLALTGAAALDAQQPAAPTADNARPVLVRAARYLDVDKGVYVSPAVILVDSGRIAGINPKKVSPDYPVVDLGNLTLLPGLIDLHTHLTFENGPDWATEPVTRTAGDLAVRGVINGRKTLLAGFTTVRDVGSHGFADVALARGFATGAIGGPRVVPAGHSIGITGGHCDVTGFAPGVLELAPEDGVADGVDAAVRAVRYQLKHGARVIKVCATAGVFSFEGSVGAQQMTAEELRAVVEEAARHGAKVAAHAHGPEGMIAAARAGVTSIEHGSLLTDEAVRVLKQQGTWYIPNLYLPDATDTLGMPPAIRAKFRTVRQGMAQSFGMALKGGLRIAFGTDAGVFPHGENAREFAVRVKRGMRPIEAIRGATAYAADVLGVSDRGVVGYGKFADLIGVAGDPLQDVTTLEDVKWVMKDGIVYKGPAAATP